MDKMREALALEIANVRFNGNQSDSLKDRAKDWLWNNIGRIEAALTHKEPEDMREAVASQIYDAMRWAVNQTPGCKGILLPNWQAGGNSFVQQKAREVAAVALQYQPSERAMGDAPTREDGEATGTTAQSGTASGVTTSPAQPSERIVDALHAIEYIASITRDEEKYDQKGKYATYRGMVLRKCREAKDALAATAPSRVQLPSEDEAVEIMLKGCDHNLHGNTVYRKDIRRAYRALLAAMKGGA